MKVFVTAGDVISHGGEEEKWNNFFSQFAPYTSKYPMMNTTGNHDTDHPESYAHFIQTFRHPYEDTKMGAYYKFIYGNCVFIMLDSDNAGQTKGYQGVIGDEQMDWLEETLEEYALKEYWVFIFMHHQIYSTGQFGMMNYYELAYGDLFDEYQVDAVFYGHDHLFEVYWKGKKTEWGGTHYCLVGVGGGAEDYDVLNHKLEPLPSYLWKNRTYIVERDGILGGNMKGNRNDEFLKEAHQFGLMDSGVVHMHINGDEAEMKFWGWYNRLHFESKFKRTGTGKTFTKPTIHHP